LAAESLKGLVVVVATNDNEDDDGSRRGRFCPGRFELEIRFILDGGYRE
jgi:hypothetical protein